MVARRTILIVDTATTRIVVALSDPDGDVGEVASWNAGHRHGETLLPTIASVLAEADLSRDQLTGLVVGTGPGAFTGLRVGIATVKGIAHGLGRPMVGVSTAEALLLAARDADHGTGSPVLLLPAGPADRLVVRPGAAPELLPGGREPRLEAGEWLVAVDLAGRASDEALDRGEAARTGLATRLARLGTVQLRGGPGPIAEVVPEYVTLPRGIQHEHGEVEWSRDPR